MSDSYVLHIVPGNGGGVDRYVRDICAFRPSDCILHVVREQSVFEVVKLKHFIPVDRVDTNEGAFAKSLGLPVALHAHSTLPPVREMVQALSRLLGIAYILTLHDTDFAAESADIGDIEREARHAFVRDSAARIVPSRFIEGVLSGLVGRDIGFSLVENGVDRDQCEIGAVARPPDDAPFEVAVVGALGPHKGLNLLLDVVAALPPEIRVVVVGYVDGQLEPGWILDNRIWVHGPFEPFELAALVRGYGSRIAFFPNQQPESYCYALSDAWCAGLPALGPSTGAIGERISRSGGGWTFDPGIGAGALAAMILDCLRPTYQQAITVRPAVDQLMSRHEMVSALNQHYDAVRSGDGRSPDLPMLDALASNQLNGAMFRAELRRLSGDLAFAKTQTAKATDELTSLAHEYDGRGLWATKLEKQLADLQAEIRRVEAARTAEHAEHLAARAALEQGALKLGRDVADTLAIAHRYERALAILPGFIRRWLLDRADRKPGEKAAP